MRKLNTLTMFAWLALPAFACAKEQKPNIIIIYADDLGYGDLECYGGTVPTPNTNQLAESGVKFINAHSTSATSTPSRFGLLTGTYPWRQEGTGIAAGNAGMIIRPDTYTLVDMAKSAGYITGAIGKWHLGIGETAIQDWNGHITPNLSDIGFDYSYIMAATGDRVPCVFIENGRVANWDSTAPIAVSYTSPFEGEPTGRNNPELLKLHPSHGHDMAVVNGISRIGYMSGGGKALWVDEDIADLIAAKAATFIEENRANPFLLYFGTHDIHVPRVPNQRFVGKTTMGARGDAILQFDYQVGEVLKAIERAGIADNTLIILSSDNGAVIDDGYKDMAAELQGSHKPFRELRGGKYSAFEGGTRVPMLVCGGKKIKKGVVSEALFSHIDFMATLSNIIGAECPENIDSKDAVNTLYGRDMRGRSYVVQQSLHNVISISDGTWKYIPASAGPTINKKTNTELGNSKEDKLYNLRTDIGERNNVAINNPKILERLKAIMHKELDMGN